MGGITAIHQQQLQLSSIAKQQYKDFFKDFKEKEKVERRGEDRTGEKRRGEKRRGEERRGEERRGERRGEERRGEERNFGGGLILFRMEDLNLHFNMHRRSCPLFQYLYTGRCIWRWLTLPRGMHKDHPIV
jgi:hypothetical protein